jgi:two-component system alkaline phosphatase synthesis response regulator PhoP
LSGVLPCESFITLSLNKTAMEMKKRVLVIEKENDMLFILANALNDAGYLVDAHTGGSCIVEGKVKLPDLFIIEKDLPAIDGLAICKYLRVHNESKEIPVIIISTYSAKRKAMHAGADAFLVKPFELVELLQTVDDCINKLHHERYSLHR